MVFHESLRDHKFSQIIRTFFSILVVLKKAEMLMVTTRPQFLQSLHLSFCDCTEYTTYNWYHRHFHVLKFVSVLLQSRSTCLCIGFISVLLYGQPERYCQQFGRFFFCCWQSLDLVVCPRLSDPFVSQNIQEVCTSYFPGRIRGCAYTIYSYRQI